MKILLSWLTDLITIKPGTSIAEIQSALIQMGHEVEGVQNSRPPLQQVVVGQVITRVAHPNAEKLGLCTVDVGDDKPRQIVCGAPNARAGITVAVALPGALLPGDFDIKVSTIRGVESQGMLCSVKELGLGTDHEGIWELTTKAKPGTPLEEANVLPAAETILELSITPNRGDCFSYLGIARELATIGLGELKPLPEPSFHSQAGLDCPTPTISSPACSQLNLLPITGLRAGIASPAVVQNRLQAMGISPKNALVDVTNYVMLTLGQPLHAYASNKLQGGLTARMATAGESLNALNGITYQLTNTDLVIADNQGPQGLAGIIGGANSAVDDSTTNIILEAATFDSASISLSGQRHQILTDARQRFERGTDPAMATIAIRYAANLLAEWAGTPTTKVGLVASSGNGAQQSQPIRYNPAFFGIFIGVDVPTAQQQKWLEALGFSITPLLSGWDVTPPTWRTYMATPEDLTEEILRMVGYETVPHQLPTSMAGQFGIDGRAIELDRKARKALTQHGFLEAMTYSFIGNASAQAYNPHATAPLQLSNPLAQTDMTTMRPSLLPGLISALEKNLAVSDPTAKLAEVGKTYHANGEQLTAAGVMIATGQRHWLGAETTPTTFTAKAAASAVLESLGAPIASSTVSTTVPPYYHPGRSGTIQVGPFTLAHFGELHPAYRAKLNIPANAGPLAIFELHLDPLLKLQNKPKSWQPNTYPPVKRDISLILNENINTDTIFAAISKHTRQIPGGVQVHTDVFDVYTGTGIPSGHYALGVALTLQSPEKTLTESEINSIIQPLITTLENTHNATIRS
jgi:phenylalanyl-tRNA synthetase beta chain